mgnify:CR=1 FL=1|jgi:hypothetical protein
MALQWGAGWAVASWEVAKALLLEHLWEQALDTGTSIRRTRVQSTMKLSASAKREMTGGQKANQSAVDLAAVMALVSGFQSLKVQGVDKNDIICLIQNNKTRIGYAVSGCYLNRRFIGWF